MNTYRIVVAGIVGLLFAGRALAGDLTITTTLNKYAGNGAYIAIYLTDSQGKYQRTLWLAGSKAKYYKHLGDWSRGSGQRLSEYDGLTGASVNSGASLRVKVTIADNLIDAGYLIRVDTAVEDLGEYRREVELPLTTTGVGIEAHGVNFIQSLSYTL